MAQKNTFFTEHYRLFSFTIEEVRRPFEEEENDFLQRDIKENSYNLLQNQEQVTVLIALRQ